jgi:RNA polymerase sigma-70 factor (ECF subfamily)
MNVENFDRLYADHYAEIFRFCFKMVKYRQDAEDLTNETFVKAYYHFDPGKKTSFRTFIFKIARNLCLDHYKSRKYQENECTDIMDADTFVDDSLETNGELLQRELMAVLHQCLDKLTDEEQLSIRFHFIEQLAYREIADIIDKSISTVKNRVESGLKNLKECLKENGIIGS